MLNLFISKEQKAIKQQLILSKENYDILQVDKKVAVDKTKVLLGSPSGALGCFAAGFLTEKIFFESNDNVKSAGKRIAFNSVLSVIKHVI